jgi:hypothetical protein
MLYRWIKRLPGFGVVSVEILQFILGSNLGAAPSDFEGAGFPIPKAVHARGNPA